LSRAVRPLRADLSGRRLRRLLGHITIIGVMDCVTCGLRFVHGKLDDCAWDADTLHVISGDPDAEVVVAEVAVAVAVEDALVAVADVADALVVVTRVGKARVLVAVFQPAAEARDLEAEQAQGLVAVAHVAGNLGILNNGVNSSGIGPMRKSEEAGAHRALSIFR